MKLFSQDTKIAALKRVPLFTDLSRKELAHLARMADEAEAKSGKVLCKEGTTGKEFFAIVEGEVDVTRQGEHLATRGPGDFIGEIALVCDVPRTATVTAKTTLRFFVLTRQDFRSLLAFGNGVEQKVMVTLAERLAALTDDLAP